MSNAIFIDANNQQVCSVRLGKNTLPDLQRLVGGYIEIGLRFADDVVLFVDEEGLFKPQRWFFRIAGIERPFAGNGVIVGPERYDATGDYIGTESLPLSCLPRVRRIVSFLSRAQADAWAKANASEPEVMFSNMDTGETEIISTTGQLWGAMPPPDKE